jgi:hypothetical protein
MISLEQITDFFNETRALHAAQKIDWSIDAECRWSYYFTDTSAEAFTTLAQHLDKEGFELVAIDESETAGEYFLQIDEVITHNPESLFALGQTFTQLAEQFGVAHYDGMDASANEIQ